MKSGKGINADQWVIDKGEYQIVPEEVNVTMAKAINESLKDARLNKGWSKDREAKLLGRIPYDILYNYAWAHGIPSEKQQDWYASEKGKHYIELLNEFPMFKASNA